MESVLGWVLSENEGGGSVKLPGMPELETKAKRLAEGVPVDAATLEQLEKSARDVGLTGFGAL